MKNILLIWICTLVALNGCASIAVDGLGGINGGSAKTQDRVKAGIFDLVTLPLQVVFLPVAFVANEINKSKREAMEEKRRQESEVVNQFVEKIKSDPIIIIRDAYLSKDIQSYEGRALLSFMEKESRGVKLPEELYLYFYENTNSNSHNHTYIWFIRNAHIPVYMLADLYHRTLDS